MSESTSSANPFRDKSSAEISQDASRDQSPRRREKKRVGFTSGDDSGERSGGRSARLSYVEPPVAPSEAPLPPEEATTGHGDRRSFHRPDIPELSQQQTNEIYQAFEEEIPLRRPRPAIRRGGATGAHLPADEVEGPDETGQRSHRQARAMEAFERGKRLEEDERSVPTSRYNSPTRAPLNRENDIPLQDLSQYQHHDDSTDDEGPEMPAIKRAQSMAREEAEAQRLVRRHTRHRDFAPYTPPTPGTRSGAVTPTDEQEFAYDYRTHPEQYRLGILSSLLKLSNQSHDRSRSQSRAGSTHRGRSYDHSAGTTPQHSPPDSGATTPTGGEPSGRWYSRRHHKGHSTSSLAQLVGSSTGLGSPVVSGLGEQVSSRLKERSHNSRPGLGKRQSSGALATLSHIRPHKRKDEEIRITKHIAVTMFRQRYLTKLCRALMMYGAPTHRLEEYMRMSARVLEIEAQFLYIPGSMIIAFDDASTHTTEVKLVRTAQGLDLGKLRDVHEVYKDVVHDVVGVEDATQSLKEITNRNNKHKRRVLIPVYGLAAACVGPFAFQARPVDLPIAFVLGCILGILQLVVAPTTDLYSNVFEVVAAVVTSFLARAFGSIHYKGERLFCFSALAQSSIALILPGYIVLCAALELQSKNIVAGSIRMVYAIIYTLFLGFGLTIGTALYGALDSDASSDPECSILDWSAAALNAWKYSFVVGFASCLVIINQGKWKQAPVMVFIALAGYAVNTNSSARFAGNLQMSSALGGLAIGGLANIYSRVGNKIENYALDKWEGSLRPHWRTLKRRIFGSRFGKTPKKLEEGDGESLYESRKRRVGYSLAAAAMLPAIFVQVPSGISVGGSLVSGIRSADQISGNGTDGLTTPNATQLAGGNVGYNDAAFNVTYSVVQIAIGVTVGLFVSAIFVYPLGKKRSGLFSF